MDRKNKNQTQNIRDIRRQYDLTSRQVADAAGVDLQIEYLMEIGGMVSTTQAEQILQALSRMTGQHYTLENVEAAVYPSSSETPASSARGTSLPQHR